MDPRRKKGIRDSINLGRKYHRLRENQTFLTSCINHRCPPHFTKFSKAVLDATKWTPKEISNRRLKKTQNVFIRQSSELEQHQRNYETSLASLESLVPPEIYQTDYKLIKSSILNFESITDRKRASKLKILISSSIPKSCPITIHNSSSVTVPSEISEILNHGSNLATGGRPNTFKILSCIESLLKSWTEFAESKNIPALTMNEVKSKLNLEMHNLRKCHSSSKSQKTLTNFLDANPTLRILQVDKSKDLIIMDQSEYLKKLKTQLPPSKFDKIPRNPLYSDLSRCGRFLRKLKPYISKSTLHSIRPTNQLKAAYGICKLHKDGEPLRIIVSSRNSITTGIEAWISEILKKMIPASKFSVDSTRKFKTNFLAKRDKFDPDFYKVVSFDVVSMFPSINLKTLIPKILDKIYSNPTRYFSPEKLDDDSICAHPPRKAFEPIFKEVLTYFTAFTTPDGFYRQKQGCAMGSKTSPLLANIMMGFLETEFIESEINKNNILLYNRYVDDSILVIKKSEITRIFHYFNNQDPSLKFTIERESENSGINFLDTNIKYDPLTKSYELNFYQKPGKSDSLQPFVKGITPPNQKLGLLSGEIFRMNNCTTNPKNLDSALRKCKEKFIKNGYPEVLINRSITRIKKSNFAPRKKDQNIEKRFFLNLEFTSERVNKIGKRIVSTIRKVTPGFKVVLAFKSIRVGSILTSRLKRKIEPEHQAGLIYKYKCTCGDEYIGETLRTFEKRTQEHVDRTRFSAIREHYDICRDFQAEFTLLRSAPNAPTNYSTADLALTRFSIAQNNLHVYRKRKYTEAFMIKLFKPILNVQVKFEDVFLL